MYANEINLRSSAENKLQFDYLLNTVRSKRRFSRWLKPGENNDLDAIKEYYGYSNQRAKEVLDILSGEQLSFIHVCLNKGGLNNDRRKKAVPVNLEDLVEIELEEQDDFLKIRETLTRIGVSSRKDKTLFQSCHILHKKASIILYISKNFLP